MNAQEPYAREKRRNNSTSQGFTATILVQIRDTGASSVPSNLCSLQAKMENGAPALLHSVSPEKRPLGRMGVPVFFSGYLSTERQCNHTRSGFTRQEAV